MSDYERRMELLNQRKEMSSSSFEMPDDKSMKASKSSLGIRIMICILCFIGFILLDYGNISIMKINSKVVTNQIKGDIHFVDLKVPKFLYK